MPQDLTSKLRIKEGYRLLTLHAPAGFLKTLGKLPKGVEVADKMTRPDQVHWFVQNQALLNKELPKIMKLLAPGVTVWAYYPKGSSGIQTDLTRDKGWECLLREGEKLTWISLISFDSTWSVFGFRLKSEDDIKKAAKPAEKREILNWIDPVKKLVRIPDDLAGVLKKYPSHKAYFDALAYSHKKEYVEWIVTAKKADTRERRLTELLKMLEAKKKNPAER